LSSDSNSDDDLELFRREMAGVRPLKDGARAPDDRPRPSPRPRQRESDEQRVIGELLLEPESEEGLETGEELLFLRSGYQKRYLQRLRRGRYAIEDHLDLHSMNETVANSALLEFLAYAVERGFGCVRIVHGKGLRSKTRPKLKMLTNRLLRRHSAVIAFASCRPADGGTGAVSVLLRSP
jgi:DNA-nicking Smr family endonuclease